MWLLLSCVVYHLPEPSDALLMAAQAQAPDATLTTLAEGRALVLDRCGNCHAIPRPSATTHRDWPETFEEMKGEAELTPAEAARIEIYLRASASPTLTPEP